MEIGSLIIRYIEALVWPVTAIIILLLFRSQIARVILRLSRFKYKDAVFEFGRDLQDAEEKAESLELPSPQVLKQVTEPITIASSYDRLFELASTSPRGAITESWLRIEIAVNEAAQKLRIEPVRNYRGWKQVITELAKQEKIPKSTVYLLDDLRKMRNNAVHTIEFEITPQEAARYVDLAIGLVYRIQTANGE